MVQLTLAVAFQESQKGNQNVQNLYLLLSKASIFVQIQKQVSLCFPGRGYEKFEKITHCHWLCWY